MDTREKQLEVLQRKDTMPKIKDSIQLGLFSGLIGSLVLDISNLIFRRNKKVTPLYTQMAGSMLNKGKTTKLSDFMFGQTLHLITGILAGVPLVYLLKKTGKDAPLIKGAAYGSFIWMIYYLFGIKMGMFSSPPKKNKTHYFSLWQNIVFGMVTAKSILTLAHPSVFFSKDQVSQQTNVDIRDSKIPSWSVHRDSDYETEKMIH